MSTVAKVDLPLVGVLAKTQNIARSIAQELNIRSAVLLSPGSRGGRGHHLRALLVDESAWPMDVPTRRELMPCLAAHKGYVLRISRHDPHSKAPSFNPSAAQSVSAPGRKDSLSK